MASIEAVAVELQKVQVVVEMLKKTNAYKLTHKSQQGKQMRGDKE